MVIPSQDAGRRLLVENISNENLTLFSGVLLTANSNTDIFTEDPSITDERALSDMQNPLGSLYIETTINNRVRVIDFDPTSLARPEVIYGFNNRVVFRRDQIESTGSGSGEFVSLPALIYINSLTGDDANYGDEANPLLTLAEARDRIPEFSDTLYEIQLVGAGPYTNPGQWPENTSVSVFGDRSSPVASKNPASFSVVAGRTAQSEDTSFGSVATTVGTHWIRYYFDFLSIVTGYSHVACLTRSSGTIGIAEGDTGVGSFIEQADVYAWETVVQLDKANIDSSPNGCIYIGCILDSVDGGGIFCDGYNFSACHADLTVLGNLNITNGTFGGYITGNATLGIYDGATARFVYMGPSSRISGQGGDIFYVIDDGSNRIRMQESGLLAYYDLENSLGIEVGGASNIIMRNGFLNNPTNFIRPKNYSSGTPSMHAATIQFVDPVTGTCQDGIELINGSSLVQNGNLTGLTSSGYDVRLDGVDYAFTASGYSNTTGGFTIP